MGVAGGGAQRGTDVASRGSPDISSGSLFCGAPAQEWGDQASGPHEDPWDEGPAGQNRQTQGPTRSP